MLRSLSILVFLIGVAACAQLTPMPSGEPASGGFELSGRVAVRYGEESSTGAVQWRHSESADDLLITNPLGQGVARITRAGQDFELQTSDGRQYRAPDPETLTAEVLGWSLPMRGLPQWVQGRPAPGNPAKIVRDGDERIAQLRQDDWDIDFEAYAGERPSRLTLSRPDLRIRLVIESWRASTP